MRGSTEGPRGAHVMKDPAATEGSRGAHVMKDVAPTEGPRGAHVMGGDPLLSIENRALHAVKVEQSVGPQLSILTSEAPLVSGGNAAPVANPHAGRTTRHGSHATPSHRWRLIPVAGAAGALVLGLGGGGAFAYLSNNVSGSGTGGTRTGTPVTLGVTATASKAELLPGLTGAAYFVLHNANSFRAVFDQVAPGATVVSDNTALCASSYASIAQTLPYSFSPAVTVSPGGTSGTQSIPDIVKLAPDAPSACQGVTFTVTLSLSGQSS